MYTLHWQPPYDWAWMLGFLRARAVSGVEVVSEGRYVRSLALGEHRGLIAVEPDEQDHTLRVTLSEGLLPVAEECLLRVGRLFDLACDPTVINGVLGDLGAARPGLRLPGSMDAFEQGIRAILGQLVSVAMAAKFTGYVANRYGEPLDGEPGFVCFPRPLGMPVKRGEAIVHFARATLDGRFPLTAPAEVEQGVKALQTFPGIGRWTANYLALRGWQAKDVFLADDYLIKQRFSGMTPAQIRQAGSRQLMAK
ncbi:MAG: hypothetical protein K0R86_1925 [Enterobacter kobei]|nr:hypothetical protein [Enterobacter kobei]